MQSIVTPLLKILKWVAIAASIYLGFTIFDPATDLIAAVGNGVGSMLNTATATINEIAGSA